MRGFYAVYEADGNLLSSLPGRRGPAALSNRRNRRFQLLEFCVAAFFQLAAAPIGVERGDLALDGGDLPLDVEGGNAALGRGDLPIQVERANLRLDRGGLAVRVERLDFTFLGRDPRVGAVVADLPLDLRDRGFVPGDAGVDLPQLGVGGSIPSAIEARNGALFRRDRTAQRTDVAADRRDLALQAAFLSADRRNPPVHRADLSPERRDL